MSYAGIGTVFAPPGSPAYKAFWDAKARECVNMADEGTCLAQVARHVPVTIGGLGDVAGVGNVVAGLGVMAALMVGITAFDHMSRNPRRRRRSRR